MLIEQILIFQEGLSSPRTSKIFQETPMPRTHMHFPGTDISLISLGGCLRDGQLKNSIDIEKLEK